MRVRVTREDYVEAAFTILTAKSHATLTIGALCRAVGVTAGSFYHYFGSWDGFVTELLAGWERDRTQRLADAVAGLASDRRVPALKRYALDLPHATEAALRVWAHSAPRVAEVVTRVDRQRFETVRAAVAAIVGSGRRADQLAAHGMSLLVGQQLWRSPVRRRELSRLLDDLEAHVVAEAGAAPR